MAQSEAQPDGSRSLAVSLCLLAILLLAWIGLSRRGLGLDDWAGWLGAAIPLLIAAIAQTQVVLAGGQGLGAGSIALLVNALVAINMTGTPGSMAMWMVAGPAIGGLIGALNGLLIGYGRVSSTAVTLATGFVTTGATFALLEGPAPVLPDAFRSLLIGDVLPGFPAALAITAALIVVARLLDLVPFAHMVRLAGRAGRFDRPPMTVLLAYVIAGIGYGLSGVFLSGELGTADPLVGSPSLLEIYAAVALGGSVPYLRQGSTLGAAIGALAVSAVVNLLLPLGIDDYWAPAIDGLLLMVALIAVNRHPLYVPAPLQSGRSPLHHGLAAWTGLGLIGAILVLRGGGAPSNDLWINCVILGTLALGQTIIVLTGALDLSLPAIIGLAGLATVSLLQGSATDTIWVVPLVLAGGGVIGIATGVVGSWLGSARILVTLAMAGLLQSAAIYLTFARPTGFASPPLQAFMADRLNGFAPVIIVVGPVLVAAVTWLHFSNLRRRLQAIAVESRYRKVDATIVGAHAAAALLAAGVGIMLAGYGGEFRVGIADTLALPSLLAITVAGISIGESRGNPVGLIPAILAVIAFDVVLIGLGLTYPLRMILMGGGLLVGSCFNGAWNSERRRSGFS